MRERKLKVYAWNFDGKRMACIAAPSWVEAVGAFGRFVSVTRAKEYGGVTENEDTVAVAMSKPGTPFTKSYRMGSEWEEYRLPSFAAPEARDAE